MAKVVVLGAGRVGLAIAWDLCQSGNQVVVVDREPGTLEQVRQRLAVQVERCDVVAEPDRLGELMSPADLVVCAVPGNLGLATLRQIVAAGKHSVDISFAPENALELDAAARARGVTAVIDMGVAPGMSNWMLGYHNTHMRVASFRCLVGGLPKVRTWPFQYKAPFSPRDVLEEYSRPARFREHGALVTRPALSDVELVDIGGVGTLEAFNTDGLRSLLLTLPHIPNLLEKTLRYPGHAELILALQKTGFFASEPIVVGGHAMAPIEVTSKILFDDWALSPDEPEFTVMQISITGDESGRSVGYRYTLYDERDPVTGFSSMARTTGFACTAVCSLILTGRWKATGVFAPEALAQDRLCHDEVIRYLASRNVIFKREVFNPDSI